MDVMDNENLNNSKGPPDQTSLLGVAVEQPKEGAALDKFPARPRPFKPSQRFQERDRVLGIQDLLWNEGLQALYSVESYEDDTALVEHLRKALPQNSDITRNRYSLNLMRWFFPDGVRGLAAKVWLNYRDPILAEEVLRYLYLRAEPMVATVVADALFGIADNSVIPERYIIDTIRRRFGENIPMKSIKRVKMNLRKLGLLVRERSKDILRRPTCSATGFLVILHHIFASGEVCGVEFKAIKENPFWKYLGFRSEDELRNIIKECLTKGLISKYVVADQIESVSFRYSFDEFVSGKRRL